MKYTLTLLLTAFSLFSFGQSTISAGLTYGINTSTFAGESADLADYQSGDRFGAFLNFSPIENFSIEPQFIVSKKGADLNFAGANNEVRITYAELPILFNLRIPIGGVLYPKVFAGPYFATRLSQRQTVQLFDEELTYDEIELKQGDIGASFGVGVDLVADRFYVSLNARADYGTNRVGNNEFTPDLKNRAYSLNAALGFVLVK